MIKTTGEKLREEGRKIGREEGRVEGLREGLLTLLDTRFGDIPAALRRRIDGAEIGELNALLRRALAAETPDDLIDEESS